MKFIKANSIVEDILDATGLRGESLDRPMIKKWVTSQLRKLDVPTIYEDKVVLLYVKNWETQLPEDFSKAVQIAFRDRTNKKVKRMEIIEWTQNMYDGSGCDLIISKQCPTCHKEESSCKCSPGIVFEVDRMWEINNAGLKYAHMGHYLRHGGITVDGQVISPYHADFKIIKATNHNYFKANHIPGCINYATRLLANCNIEYKLEEPRLILNREEGEILLSYLAPKLDEEGYQLIPDIEEVIEALKYYAIEQYNYRQWNKAPTQEAKQHYKNLYQEAKADRFRSMGAANEILNTPNFEDWMVFLEQNYAKLIKDNNSLGVRTPDTYANTMERLANHG